MACRLPALGSAVPRCAVPCLLPAVAACRAFALRRLLPLVVVPPLSRPQALQGLWLYYAAISAVPPCHLPTIPF